MPESTTDHRGRPVVVRIGGDPSGNVARVLLAARSRGAFGTATLKSPLTALQAALGLAGLYLMNR
jgi:hypothetical protein